MAASIKMKTTDFEYDVCLSFAGEDRPYVKEVAEELRQKGIRVFYDEYKRAELWGKDLYTHLDDVYQNAARYCVLFASTNYATKLWTNHERQSAQARAFSENHEYILPVRFDDTAIPGVRDTVGYIDLRKTTPHELANLIAQKVGVRPRANYLPPVPDLLFDALDIANEKDKEVAYLQTQSLVGLLKRMSLEEREVVYMIFLHGCVAELPDNVHINIDLLRRLTRFTPTKLKRIMGGLQSLGLFSSIRDDGDEDFLGKCEILVLEWHVMKTIIGGNVTDVAFEMIRGATNGLCEEHGLEALRALDFSQLASVTTTVDEHKRAG